MRLITGWEGLEPPVCTVLETVAVAAVPPTYAVSFLETERAWIFSIQAPSRLCAFALVLLEGARVTIVIREARLLAILATGDKPTTQAN